MAKIASKITGIQHIGIPTADMQATLAFYEGLGFVREWEDVERPVVFLRLGDCVIQTYFLGKTAGQPGAIAYIALNVTDVDAVFDDLLESGYHLLDKGVQYLPLYRRGVRFFSILGPNGETIAFHQML